MPHDHDNLTALTLAVEAVDDGHSMLLVDHDLAFPPEGEWSAPEGAAVAHITSVLARVACVIQPAMRWEAHRHRCHARALHYTPKGATWQGVRDTRGDTFEALTCDGGDVCEVTLFDPAADGGSPAQLAVTVPTEQVKPWRARLDAALAACTA